jgi:Aspartyl protease
MKTFVHCLGISLFVGSYFGFACVAQAAPEDASLLTPVATIKLEPYLRAQSIVHAVVNGQPGTFLFDTGEGVSSISPSFASRVDCHSWGQITGFRMTGERVDTPHCDGVQFRFGQLVINAPTVIVLDIMKFMGSDVPTVDGALGLDLFADRVVTIIPRQELIVESDASLVRRVANAKELPIRLVRDAEGAALCVDAAVKTPNGMAWMELDGGNGGSILIANHIAPLLGLTTDISTPRETHFDLANGIEVKGTVRTRDLIMDGDISAQFLNHWALTLDLKRQRAWLAPLPDYSTSPKA